MPVDTERSQLGAAAVELYRMVSGHTLTDEEATALHKMLERDVDGKWQERTHRGWFGGAVLEARALAGLFLLDEQRVVWSTFLYRSAHEAFLRIRDIIDGSEALRLQVKRTCAARGDEHIDLRDGRRIDFVLRQSPKALRGMATDCHLLDEAGRDRDPLGRVLAESMPMLATRPNSQLVISYG